MELKNLIGEHELSGLDCIIIPRSKNDYSYYDANAFLFILDGITYKAIENPDDGYRSYLKDLETTDEKVSYTFSPQKVIGKMMKSGVYGKNDGIQFFDSITDKLVLEIGTKDYDDYYPCCILNWYPENMNINQ